jgi:YD repeat-containing protein
VVDVDGVSITREYQWDVLRLLSWQDKTTGRDPRMERTYDGARRLIEQRDYAEDAEEDLLLTTTYLYQGPGRWPTSRRSVVAITGESYDQAMDVVCSP